MGDEDEIRSPWTLGPEVTLPVEPPSHDRLFGRRRNGRLPDRDSGGETEVRLLFRLEIRWRQSTYNRFLLIPWVADPGVVLPPLVLPKSI